MTRGRLPWGLVAGSVLVLAAWPGGAVEPIPGHRQRQIWEAAPSKPRVPPASPRRVLVFNTPQHLYAKDPHKGYCIPYGSYAIEALGRKTGAFEPVVSDDLAWFLPERIGRFDAIVLNNTSGPWITPTEEDLDREAFRGHGRDIAGVERVLRDSLLGYVAGGGGLVAYHFAIGANRQWPGFHELLGATFTGHPWNEEVGVVVEEPDHPLVAAFGGRDFRLADEIYPYGDPYDRGQLRVLLSLDTERANMGVKGIRRQDNDFALAWIKAHGKGRVFYTSFGHRTELFWNPAVLQFYLDAIQFAGGDLEVPADPCPDRPNRRGPGPTPPEEKLARMRARNVAAPTADQIARIQAAAPPLSRHAAARSWSGGTSGSTSRIPTENLRQLDPDAQAAARQFDQAVKASILAFVRGGKGIVGIHAATAALQNWPEYGQMMGAYYGGHIHQEVPIRIDEPGHPINACFGGKTWRIEDEIYIPRDPYRRANVRVLLSLDLDHMPDPGKRPDRDYPVSWVRPYGKGRVFYTTLGHAVPTYWNPLCLEHLLAGIRFAIGELRAESAPP